MALTIAIIVILFGLTIAACWPPRGGRKFFFTFGAIAFGAALMIVAPFAGLFIWLYKLKEWGAW